MAGELVREEIIWTDEEHDAMADHWIGRVVLFRNIDDSVRPALVMNVSEPPAWGTEPTFSLVAVRNVEYEHPGLDFYHFVSAHSDIAAHVARSTDFATRLGRYESWMPYTPEYD